MDNRLEKLQDKAEQPVEKLYFSLTSDDPGNLDEVEAIYEKYKERFEELGVKCRIKDRR